MADTSEDLQSWSTGWNWETYPKDYMKWLKTLKNGIRYRKHGNYNKR